MRWHEEVLDAAGRKAAARLRPLAARGFYLAGGTALALRMGHRVSLDLDLFSAQAELDAAGRGDIVAGLKTSGKVRVVDERDGTCHLRLGGTAVSLFRYGYRLLGPLSEWEGLPVAALEDIAAMKLSAVVGRGARKDFLDLYELARRLGLAAVLRAGLEKFPDHPDFDLQAARGLVYFADAEKEPLPRLLRPVAWADVKAFFRAETARYVRKRAAH